MTKYVVIVAGGSGTRMNSAVPKQFLLLKGRPLLYHTIRAFLDADPGCRLVLVLPQDHMEKGKEILENFFPGISVEITAGGDTRFHSVQNGLRMVKEESIVFVHDAVRCLISPVLIKRCYDAAMENGSAVPVIASKDSVRLLIDDGNMPLERNRIKLVQTPQVFLSKILLPAFDTAYNDQFTDEATVVEAAGAKVFLVEGEETNIKITLPVDLELAGQIMDEREKGSGK